MNKSNYLYLTALLAFLFSTLNAQQFYFSKENPANCSATDGIITLIPTRGVPPFTYQWSTGATDVSLRNIPKGTYNATLTDATGASISHAFILNTEELDLTLASSTFSGGCNPNSGALTVSPVNGAAPFTYNWSNGGTDASIQGLSAGTYSVTVQDANGCVALGEYAVQDLGWVYFASAQIGVSDRPDCVNQSNGELSASMVYNNFLPNTYIWSTGATDADLTNLTKGVYSVTITDALGCSATTSVFLDNKIDMTGNVVCAGNTQGTTSAELINATAPVTYNWSNGQQGSNLNGLSAGFYTVTATDAQGCAAISSTSVAEPTLNMNDYSQRCFTGNKGYGYCHVWYDQGVTYLWDNGENTPWSNTLSPGIHTITVTTALGCTLNGSVNIAQPLAPEFTINAVPSDADCANGVGGAININITGGIQPYQTYVYGPDGFWSNSLTTLQNLASGDYYVNIQTTNGNCYGSTSVHVSDAGGFEPSLVTTDIDCSLGFGSAAVVNVTAPNVQYAWSTGATDQALFNLTQGCYSVTVSGDGSCLNYLRFCLPKEDSLNLGSCLATASGQLINDLGVSGCSGTTGIRYQMIRTMPSGAINFTDEDGKYAISLPNGTFNLDAVQYSPGDIACPAGGVQTVNSLIGQTVTGLDFHFLNSNDLDLNIQQRPLRTAQPGYPYSVRMDVCNTGNVATPGTLDVEYGNILGTVGTHHFAQHAGAIVLNTENAGSPNNNASFSFPNLAAGSCELLQLDLQTTTTTPAGTEFITEARVNPSSGDPTPQNNISTLYNTVMGAFDPNSVLAYPARNGNPKDGGEIIRDEDNTIVYQIFFQNTGNAPADLVVIRDLLDENLDLSTIRNITASHGMKVNTRDDNKELVFRFENINLPDSTSDYAGSIGSIQYQIDLKPGVSLGAEVNKQVAIYFDFNTPVITNENVLEVVSSTKTTQVITGNKLELFPNPTDAQVGFYCDGPSTMSVYSTTGALVATVNYEVGLQQFNTAELPNGMYLIRMNTNGKLRSGKLVVSH